MLLIYTIYESYAKWRKQNEEKMGNYLPCCGQTGLCGMKCVKRRRKNGYSKWKGPDVLHLTCF